MTHRRFERLICALALLVLMTGCAHYAPPKVDPKTGFYSTGTTLDKGDVLVRKSTANLSKYRFVFLNAETNVYPARFEFFVREALSKMGFRHIINSNEIAALARQTSDQTALNGQDDFNALTKLSNTIGPFLAAGFVSHWDGDIRREVKVKIVDASNGEVLLQILHNKMIWLDVDSEAHYPVMNEVKKWVDSSSQI